MGEAREREGMMENTRRGGKERERELLLRSK